MTQSRKRILLAELDDRLAISLHSRLYEHNRTFDVLLSRTADVTQDLIDGEQLELVVIHAHPSKPGDIARLEEQLRRRGTRIVALIDAAVTTAASSLYAAGADSVRSLGSAGADLCEEILRVARTDTLLEGRLDQVGTAELIQMFCLCRRSLMLRIVTARERAAVWLHEGEIHHAVSDALSGQSAMTPIVRADRGRFRAIGGVPPPPRTIHQDWQHVMLEAAREHDEVTQRASQRPKEAPRSSGGPHHSEVRALGKSYRELTELGLQSIKAGDFNKAREYWDAARAIGADSPEVAPVTVIKATPPAGHKRSERAGRR
jgi:uncharacterized protein DUF4388